MMLRFARAKESLGWDAHSPAYATIPDAFYAHDRLIKGRQTPATPALGREDRTRVQKRSSAQSRAPASVILADTKPSGILYGKKGTTEDAQQAQPFGGVGKQDYPRSLLA
ncbi:uncharacterized protein UV8b_02687 [Ustilaginoidea virens]|uniref:Uncharacterized protein n=1 Tax=Ustilaginoidea virens TaxID=1159556 RepID=A0A8E5HN32_USTVR|nr:uncharacterized protein UV8b_02687 [Ustilaginoidea virens]QUC18446.1 hypothetical protein UV8b_02687 [Ustilaginoidea virens]